MPLHVTVLEKSAVRCNPKSFLHSEEKVALVIIQEKNAGIM